ncbi:entericidin A [Coraliomargarita sinensis]|nr:entericidin A [Coraliomargarita sinensis]
MSKSTKLTLTALLTLALFALSGCNTVKGIGEDFEAMGESMQNAGD